MPEENILSMPSCTRESIMLRLSSAHAGFLRCFGYILLWRRRSVCWPCCCLQICLLRRSKNQSDQRCWRVLTFSATCYGLLGPAGLAHNFRLAFEAKQETNLAEDAGGSFKTAAARWRVESHLDCPRLDAMAPKTASNESTGTSNNVTRYDHVSCVKLFTANFQPTQLPHRRHPDNRSW